MRYKNITSDDVALLGLSFKNNNLFANFRFSLPNEEFFFEVEARKFLKEYPLLERGQKNIFNR